MGLLLAISKDDIATFTVAKPDGLGGFVDGTYVATLGPDTWDANIDQKKMLLWQNQKTIAKVHVVIAKHPTPSFGALQLTTADPAFAFGDFLSLDLATGIAFGSRNDDPTGMFPGDVWGPIATGITNASVNAQKNLISLPTIIRDDLIDYERLNVNFKSVCCDVTRNKADLGFNQSDYRAQAVSATMYHQSLFLFEDATGCTGAYFGGTNHDFRPGRLPYALGNMFGVRVQTGDANVPNPFLFPSLISQHYATGSGGSIDNTFHDDLGNLVTASISYNHSYDLKLDTFVEVLS